MITRRRFAHVAAGCAAAFSLSQTHSACSAASTDTKGAATRVDFIAYGFPYDWHPIPVLGNWPLDHTSAVTATGTQWGCFGRTYAADPRNATIVAKGSGDEMCAKAIAGPDGSAGIENGSSVVCDQCAYRILLPAGVDVRASPGNEIAILFAGVYGFGMKALVKRIEDAAAAVDRDVPGRIPDADVARAVTTVTGGLKDEWQTVRTNNDRILKPAMAAADKTVEADLENVYLSFYDRRMALYHAFRNSHLDKRALVLKLRDAISQSLSDLKDLMGAENYARIVPIPPQIVAVMDRKMHDEQR